MMSLSAHVSFIFNYYATGAVRDALLLTESGCDQSGDSRAFSSHMKSFQIFLS
jgi:hypothetical protein